MELLLSSQALSDYVDAHVTAPRPLLDELREITYRTMKSAQMQVGAVEGTLLSMLVALTGARRVLEIGTFTGYSALCMAESLPRDGELLTCDMDDEALRIAQTFFDRDPAGSRIRILRGPALETIARLPETPSLDLVFMDADKREYPAYFDLVFPRLRQGGLIVTDNTLWSGRVLHPESADDLAIAAFNDRVSRDPRVQSLILSVRDGITLTRKL